MPEEDYSVMYTLTRRSTGSEAKIIVKGESFPAVKDQLAAGYSEEAANEMIASILNGGAGVVAPAPDERQVAEKMAKAFDGKVIDEIPNCPKCGGEMWDNRPKKLTGEYGAKSPDFSCKDETCLTEKGYRTGVWLDPPRRSKRES